MGFSLPTPLSHCIPLSCPIPPSPLSITTSFSALNLSPSQSCTMEGRLGPFGLRGPLSSPLQPFCFFLISFLVLKKFPFPSPTLPAAATSCFLPFNTSAPVARVYLLVSPVTHLPHTITLILYWASPPLLHSRPVTFSRAPMRLPPCGARRLCFSPTLHPHF